MIVELFYQEPCARRGGAECWNAWNNAWLRRGSILRLVWPVAVDVGGRDDAGRGKLSVHGPGRAGACPGRLTRRPRDRPRPSRRHPAYILHYFDLLWICYRAFNTGQPNLNLTGLSSLAQC